MATPLETAKGPTSPRIQRVRWNHDLMIDFILGAAGSLTKVTQNDIAKHFHVSPMWVSCIINSDAFQARLAERKTEVVDPLIRGDLEEAIKGLVSRSVDILRKELDKKPSFDGALEVFKASNRALGMGQKSNVTVNVSGENSLISVLSGINERPRTERVIEAEEVGPSPAQE